jgi:hypothetical protein
MPIWRKFRSPEEGGKAEADFIPVVKLFTPDAQCTYPMRPRSYTSKEERFDVQFRLLAMRMVPDVEKLLSLMKLPEEDVEEWLPHGPGNESVACFPSPGGAPVLGIGQKMRQGFLSEPQRAADCLEFSRGHVVVASLFVRMAGICSR